MLMDSQAISYAGSIPSRLKVSAPRVEALSIALLSFLYLRYTWPVSWPLFLSNARMPLNQLLF